MERHQKYPHFNICVPSSKTGSINVQKCSRLEKSIGAEALCAKSTKRRVILALVDLLCLFVSASVEMSSSPKLDIGNSAGPDKTTKMKIDSNLA